jgi:hypothetical protein
MANPLQTITGMADTLRHMPDLPAEERLQMLDAIYKQAKVLEKVCLDPKIMHASELELEPRPLLRSRDAPSAPEASP